MVFKLFAILQKYDFSSKSQPLLFIFVISLVVCDTAKVRFFKQITTFLFAPINNGLLFAILQKYDFSSKSQPMYIAISFLSVVCDTAKVRFFKQITTKFLLKSPRFSCLRYCKSTIFQANHNEDTNTHIQSLVVCDTAKVRFFKQITTEDKPHGLVRVLFAILQKYDFSSKSQPFVLTFTQNTCCLRYCKSTIFQANHNGTARGLRTACVVCDTAKVRFFKQITTLSAKAVSRYAVVCDTAKVRFFKQITTG